MIKTKEAISDVSNQQMLQSLAQHFERQDKLFAHKNWNWQELGNVLQTDPYRICGVVAHSGVMLGRKGGAFIWKVKYSPEFSKSLKLGGAARFQKVRGAHWRSRPNGLEGATLIAEAASKHFQYLVYLDTNELWMSRADELLPTQGSPLLVAFRDPVWVTENQIYKTLTAARPSDDLNSESLHICNGMDFSKWPDDGLVGLNFKKALIFIRCNGLQPRYFEVEILADKSLRVIDIAFGARSKGASRMMAAFRQSCGGRPAYTDEG